MACRCMTGSCRWLHISQWPTRRTVATSPSPQTLASSSCSSSSSAASLKCWCASGCCQVLSLVQFLAAFKSEGKAALFLLFCHSLLLNVCNSLSLRCVHVDAMSMSCAPWMYKACTCVSTADARKRGPEHEKFSVLTGGPVLLAERHRCKADCSCQGMTGHQTLPPPL